MEKKRKRKVDNNKKNINLVSLLELKQYLTGNNTRFGVNPWFPGQQKFRPSNPDYIAPSSILNRSQSMNNTKSYRPLLSRSYSTNNIPDSLDKIKDSSIAKSGIKAAETRLRGPQQEQQNRSPEENKRLNKKYLSVDKIGEGTEYFNRTTSRSEATNETKAKAATKIQAVTRGKLGRKEAEKKRLEKEAEEKQVNNELKKAENEEKQANNELNNANNEVKKAANEEKQANNELNNANNEVKKAETEEKKTENNLNAAIREQNQVRQKYANDPKNGDSVIRKISTKVKTLSDSLQKLKKNVSEKELAKDKIVNKWKMRLASVKVIIQKGIQKQKESKEKIEQAKVKVRTYAALLSTKKKEQQEIKEELKKLEQQVNEEEKAKKEQQNLSNSINKPKPLLLTNTPNNKPKPLLLTNTPNNTSKSDDVFGYLSSKKVNQGLIKRLKYYYDNNKQEINKLNGKDVNNNVIIMLLQGFEAKEQQQIKNKPKDINTVLKESMENRIKNNQTGIINDNIDKQRDISFMEKYFEKLLNNQALVLEYEDSYLQNKKIFETKYNTNPKLKALVGKLDLKFKKLKQYKEDWKKYIQKSRKVIGVKESILKSLDSKTQKIPGIGDIVEQLLVDQYISIFKQNSFNTKPQLDYFFNKNLESCLERFENSKDLDLKTVLLNLNEESKNIINDTKKNKGVFKKTGQAVLNTLRLNNNSILKILSPENIKYLDRLVTTIQFTALKPEVAKKTGIDDLIRDTITQNFNNNFKNYNNNKENLEKLITETLKKSTIRFGGYSNTIPDCCDSLNTILNEESQKAIVKYNNSTQNNNNQNNNNITLNPLFNNFKTRIASKLNKLPEKTQEAVITQLNEEAESIISSTSSEKDKKVRTKKWVEELMKNNKWESMSQDKIIKSVHDSANSMKSNTSKSTSNSSTTQTKKDISNKVTDIVVDSTDPKNYGNMNDKNTKNTMNTKNTINKLYDSFFKPNTNNNTNSKNKINEFFNLFKSSPKFDSLIRNIIKIKERSKLNEELLKLYNNDTLTVREKQFLEDILEGGETDSKELARLYSKFISDSKNEEKEYRARMEREKKQFKEDLLQQRYNDSLNKQAIELQKKQERDSLAQEKLNIKEAKKQAELERLVSINERKETETQLRVQERARRESAKAEKAELVSQERAREDAKKAQVLELKTNEANRRKQAEISRVQQEAERQKAVAESKAQAESLRAERARQYSETREQQAQLAAQKTEAEAQRRQKANELRLQHRTQLENEQAVLQQSVSQGRISKVEAEKAMRQSVMEKNKEEARLQSEIKNQALIEQNDIVKLKQQAHAEQQELINQEQQAKINANISKKQVLDSRKKEVQDSLNEDKLIAMQQLQAEESQIINMNEMKAENKIQSINQKRDTEAAEIERKYSIQQFELQKKYETQLIEINNKAMNSQQKINETYVNNESDILLKSESLKQKVLDDPDALKQLAIVTQEQINNNKVEYSNNLENLRQETDTQISEINIPELKKEYAQELNSLNDKYSLLQTNVKDEYSQSNEGVKETKQQKMKRIEDYYSRKQAELESKYNAVIGELVKKNEIEKSELNKESIVKSKEYKKDLVSTNPAVAGGNNIVINVNAGNVNGNSKPRKRVPRKKSNTRNTKPKKRVPRKKSNTRNTKPKKRVPRKPKTTRTVTRTIRKVYS